MNWFTENKIFTSVLMVIVVAALALGYLTFAASGKYDEAVQSYQTGMAKLTQLRSLAPYRNTENLKKVQAQVTEYKGQTEELHAELIQRQGMIAPIDPSAFQGHLRELVSKTIEHSTQRGVELPPKFYLGFERYESELPRNDITGLLNWQLAAIDAVVNRLIDLKVAKISSVLRPALPGELVAEPSSKDVPLFKKYPFEVVFVGYPGNVQTLLNDLDSFPQFTIARAVRIENEQLKSPSRTAAAPVSTGDPSATPEPLVDKIIIGKERVTASIIVDLVQFTPKQISKK
ncbi:MAG: Amuc_1100 family pilus-like protein [Chthoniobacterales bacterium]